MAEQAIREKRTHLGYLDALLTAEIEEREKNIIERRIKEARLPRVKTLEDFDFQQSPLVDAAKLRDLAEGGYIDRAEPVLLIGDCVRSARRTSVLFVTFGVVTPHPAGRKRGRVVLQALPTRVTMSRTTRVRAARQHGCFESQDNIYN